MMAIMTASLTDGFVSGFFDSIHTYAATHFYLSPFWFWVCVVAGLWLVLILLGWMFPGLRPYLGLVGLGLIMGLVGYRRGENDANAHNAAIRAREQQKKQQRDNGWRW